MKAGTNDKRWAARADPTVISGDSFISLHSAFLTSDCHMNSSFIYVYKHGGIDLRSHFHTLSIKLYTSFSVVFMHKLKIFGLYARVFHK